MPDTPSLIMTIWILSMLGLFFVIKVLRKKFARKKAPVTFGQLKEMTTPLKEMMDGARCGQCKERYVGLARDCRCTNWGR